MKRLLGFGLLTALMVALVLTQSSDGAPQQYIRQRHFEANDTHRHHRTIVRLIDVAQINPAYVSSYSPDNYDSTTQTDILAEIRSLASQIQVLQARLANAPMSQAPGSPKTSITAPKTETPTPKSGAPVVNGLTVLNLKCAACHQSGKLLPDQKFTLLDPKGQLATLTDKQKLRVMMKTYQGQMPPPNNSQRIEPITDAEYAAIVNLLQPGS